MINKFTHLAPAPHKIVHYEYREHGSSCDHCGAFIKHVFTVEGSNGIRFQLGVDHAEQVGGTELAGQAKRFRKEVEQEEQRLKYMEQRERELVLEKAEAEKNRQEYIDNKPKLQKLPHPNEYFASRGKTMVDYIEYFHHEPENADWEHWTAHLGDKVKQALEDIK